MKTTMSTTEKIAELEQRIELLEAALREIASKADVNADESPHIARVALDGK